jgi:hypothetical protein
MVDVVLLYLHVTVGHLVQQVATELASSDVQAGRTGQCR